ncbi:TPA: hypothetical protein EYP70_05320 [Candidatus Bathyarchaeota archaeon]|nr:hypothetical protein [Candidatus Bathyarchaeota archaeon]
MKVDLSKFRRLPCKIIAYSILLEEGPLETGPLLRRVNKFCLFNGWKPFTRRSLHLALRRLEKKGIVRGELLKKGFYGVTIKWTIIKREHLQARLIPKDPDKAKYFITISSIAKELGISPDTISKTVNLLRKKVLSSKDDI